MAQRISPAKRLTPTDWMPQPGPQLAALEADWCFELLFGGARGGGKSIVLLLDFLQDVPKYGSGWNGIIIRHTYKQLEQLIRDSYKIFPQTGAVFEKQPKTWHWLNGATLRFRNLERIEDTADYQGASFQFLGIDEAGNYPDPEVYYRMLATLRSGDVEVPTIRARLTANPGGPGHHWLKERYIDPAPTGYKPIATAMKTGVRERMFIPSRVTDNVKLMEADPYYVENLKMQGSPELVRAWLDGDWSVMIGAFFSEFKPDHHIVTPFNIPTHWYKYRAFDWGSAEPFCVLWAAVADGNPVRNNRGETIHLQRGTLVIYREWYGMEQGKNNTGLRLKNEAIAEGIKQRTGQTENVTLTLADSWPFKEDGGISIAETFAACGVPLMRADNSRIPGWQQVRSRLQGTAKGPLVVIFDTCTHLIRTLPALQCDQRNFEDTDDKYEDHACLSADTLVDTTEGQIAIEKLVGKTGYLYSRDGHIKPYSNVRMTREHQQTYKVSFSDGRHVVATADHKFLMVSDEWKELRDIRPDDVIQSVTYAISNNHIRHNSRVSGDKILPLRQLLQQAIKKIQRWQEVAQKSMGVSSWADTKRYAYTSSGRRQIEQSNREFRTNEGRRTPVTAYDTRAQGRDTAKVLRESGGISGQIESMAQNTRGQEVSSATCKRAMGEHAKNHSFLSAMRKRLRNLLQSAESLKILSPKLQNDCKTATVKSITKDIIQDVYCLEVPETHALSVNGGIIVHNCDVLRYLCMERPIVRKRPSMQRLRSINEMTFNELLEHDRYESD